MNKLDEAFQKVSDRIGSEWRNHGWRKMTNEEVDADVQKALCIIEELVDRNKVLEAKATPKKPIGIDTTVSWFTSGICECGNTVFMFDMNGDLDDRFCNKCGQAILWEE